MSGTDYDARGLLCPLPVLKARKLLSGMEKGDVLTITCDDAMALVDLPHFCSEAGHEVLRITEGDDAQVFEIKRGP